MPTHEEWAQFLREWAKLTVQQQTLFLAAVHEMVEDSRDHVAFRPSLRATFHYGREQRPGQPHIVWRRIGGHDILKNP